jgi:FtsH-binding integral membrane protein
MTPTHPRGTSHSDASQSGASQSDAFAELLRGSLLPTLAAAAVCVVVGLFSGPREAWSAAFGALLVILFFGAGLLVMKGSADRAPTTVMLLVMVTYTVKVLLLGATLFLLRDAAWLSGFAAGLAITVCTLVWLFFELRAYRRLRIFAFDPGPQDVAR